MEVLGLNINLSSIKATYNPNMIRYAIMQNDIISVKMYIAAGVDLNLRDFYKQTALEAARAYRRADIIKLLENTSKINYNIAC